MLQRLEAHRVLACFCPQPKTMRKPEVKAQPKQQSAANSDSKAPAQQQQSNAANGADTTADEEASEMDVTAPEGKDLASSAFLAEMFGPQSDARLTEAMKIVAQNKTIDNPRTAPAPLQGQ